MAARMSDHDDLGLNAEINITPFIDVILVLLIIFMVAAPLSTVDVAVELPVASAKAAPRPTAPIFVTLHRDLTLSLGDLTLPLGDLTLSLAQLPGELDIATRLKRDVRIYISADRAVPYGEVMAVMNRMRGAGYLKISLVGLEETADLAASAP